MVALISRLPPAAPLPGLRVCKRIRDLMRGSYGVEGKIATVAGSPTLHFPDRARVPCLATLALILTYPASLTGSALVGVLT